MSSSTMKTIAKSANSISSSETNITKSSSVHDVLVVFASFVLLMISVGPCSVVGVLLEEYKSNVFPDTPTATISWIGTLQFSVMSCLCVTSGMLLERYDVRLVVFVGSIVSGVAYIIASFCNSAIMLLLIQGILFGIGASSLVIAGMSLPSQWLQKHQTLGTGIAISGGSIGGLWLSFATQAIISNPKLGWRWALRITGIVIICAGCAVSPLLKRRVAIKKPQNLIDLAVLKSWRFISWFTFSLLGCGAYYLAYSYMSAYSVEVLHESSSWSANISSILNASSIFGRIVVGFVADYAGNLNCLVISSIASSLAFLTLWLPFHNLHMLIAAAVVTGFSTGSVATLIASATAQLFGVERLSTVLGFVLVSEALGTCICVPVAGALLDAYDTYNGFTAIIWYGGAFYSAATVILVGLRLSVASVFRRV